MGRLADRGARARWGLAASVALALAAATAPREAAGFCGFYVGSGGADLFNNATQVVLMREGTRTVLSMQNNYQGPPENFAMVVPVPVVLQKDNVKTLTKDVFARVEHLDAPRLVEYWEQDPCEARRQRDEMVAMPPPMPAAAAPMGGAGANLGVKIEAQFKVGEYEIVILSAKDSTGLETWLHLQSYNIPAGAEPLLRPYVQQGMKFFVAKVDVTKVTWVDHDGKKTASLSPLRFHYDSDSFSLPVRLGLVNSGGTQDLIVHILAKDRYEVANYPNATIPTNFDVDETARPQFGAMYAALFDRTVEKNPKAVITEYAWQATSCDPCPGPPLEGSDFATLGGDVLPSAALATGGGNSMPVATVPAPMPVPAPSGKGLRAAPAPPSPPPPPSMPPPGMWMQNPYATWTLTRLHARYGKDALGDDLVFRVAGAILGGREVRNGDGTLEHGATPTGGDYNNFQARYAIRHPWTGPVACADPLRGVWGGPPNGQTGSTAPTPATDLAFVNRSVQLASFVRSDVPELGITAPPPPAPAINTAAPPPNGVTGGANRGCAGCATSGRGGGGVATVLGSLLAVTAGMRRRRRSARRVT